MEMKRILIVDEEPAFLHEIQKLLRGPGVHVDTAETAEGAEALLAREAYDGVISDVRLSPPNGEEGLEIARLARSRRSTSKVVLMTVDRSPELEATMSALGVDSCFEKPVPIEVLRRALNGKGATRR